MKTVISFILISFTLAFGACKQKKEVVASTRDNITSTKPQDQPVSKPLADSQRSNELVIAYKRTPCFGTCGVYEAKIYGDGRVEYEGKNFVDNIGFYTAKMDTETIDALLADAAERNFLGLDDEYPTEISDFPTRTLTMRVNGTTKTVKCIASGPEEFRHLERVVENQIKELTLKPAETQQK